MTHLSTFFSAGFIKECVNCFSWCDSYRTITIKVLDLWALWRSNSQLICVLATKNLPRWLHQDTVHFNREFSHGHKQRELNTSGVSSWIQATWTVAQTSQKIGNIHFLCSFWTLFTSHNCIPFQIINRVLELSVGWPPNIQPSWPFGEQNWSQFWWYCCI